MHLLIRFLAALGAGFLGQSCLAADSLVCHVTYGGETQTMRADTAPSPYQISPVAVGSYFLFRMVVERNAGSLAAVKLYTYADRDETAVPIHVAEFPYPPVAGRRHGFTGIQRVYEPVRDGELEYWCEMRKRGAAK
ncbi:hypothetical protein OPU71_02475 [Niveibacterium sp. 24ML]|uniref:hypothetical protein n=1 Tax=Niveibacterium sp. 24ML TaxID=2985512 RepID=UPI00226DC404|nr:hypothetical protein [Niveibacterium sp. 24ML]MCX9154986.1 hypothetical protein [Niveibacterium sp. 24ML]